MCSCFLSPCPGGLFCSAIFDLWVTLCRVTIKMRSLLLTWGAHKPLRSMKWVLKCWKSCVLRRRETGTKTSWGCQKWVWHVNLCCPHFYNSFFEMISKFPSILLAVYGYSASFPSLFVWSFGSWPTRQRSPYTSSTVANSTKRQETTPLKECECKTQLSMFWDL